MVGEHHKPCLETLSESYLRVKFPNQSWREMCGQRLTSRVYMQVRGVGLRASWQRPQAFGNPFGLATYWSENNTKTIKYAMITICLVP